MRLTSIIPFSLLIIMSVGCSSPNSEEVNNTNETIAESNTDVISIDTNSVVSSVEALETDSTKMTEAAFLALFEFDFPQQFDFGFRYVEANYDDVPESEDKVYTPYNARIDFSINDGLLLENGKTVDLELEGLPHSYRMMDENYLLIMYVEGEISQEFVYYLVDNEFQIIKSEILAESGGDEGAWYHSFGTFSTDFSDYQIFSYSGEGRDTTDYGSDVYYIQ